MRPQLDMWALGVTVYLWAFGKLPFDGTAPFMVYESIWRQELKTPSCSGLSEELLDIIGQP